MTNETSLTIIDTATAIARVKAQSDIVNSLRSQSVLRQGIDFGIIPGTKKPTLLKPGAERLCSAFGLAPESILVSKQENWNPESPLFHYEYQCRLTHIETGVFVGSANGSCNSMESKYRYRWLWPNEISEEDRIGLVTRKTKNGTKQYRVDNDDVFSQVNTISKMAQKRALVAAVLNATNASDHFTQDMEDLRLFGDDVVSGQLVEEEKEQLEWPSPEAVDALCDWLRSYELDLDALSNEELGAVVGIKNIADMREWGLYPTGQDAGKAILKMWEQRLVESAVVDPDGDSKEAQPELPIEDIPL